jgi:acyl carrier protein
MHHTTTEIHQSVHDYIVERYLSPGDAKTFDDDDDLLAILDSLQILRMLIDMEARFSIRVANSELMPENLGSVSKLGAFIQRKLDGQS